MQSISVGYFTPAPSNQCSQIGMNAIAPAGFSLKLLVKKTVSPTVSPYA
ncbi:hypothetical protein [Spirulina major]|nr:hypothetical protein [Spirulina major]